MFGTPSIISEVLSGKRELNKEHQALERPVSRLSRTLLLSEVERRLVALDLPCIHT